MYKIFVNLMSALHIHISIKFLYLDMFHNLDTSTVNENIVFTNYIRHNIYNGLYLRPRVCASCHPQYNNYVLGRQVCTYLIYPPRRAGRFHMLGMITGGAYMDDDEGQDTNLQILRRNKRLNVIVLLLYIIILYCIIQLAIYSISIVQVSNTRCVFFIDTSRTNIENLLLFL